jgi:hypothetical protein
VTAAGLLTAAVWLAFAALVIGVCGYLQHRRARRRARPPRVPSELITIRLKGERLEPAPHEAVDEVADRHEHPAPPEPATHNATDSIGNTRAKDPLPAHRPRWQDPRPTWRQLTKEDP